MCKNGATPSSHLHQSARGQFVFSFFLSFSPYEIVIDPYCKKKKVFLAATPKIFEELSVLCVHTLPSHYVSPLTKLIEQCYSFPQTFVASAQKIVEMKTLCPLLSKQGLSAREENKCIVQKVILCT